MIVNPTKKTFPADAFSVKDGDTSLAIYLSGESGMDIYFYVEDQGLRYSKTISFDAMVEMMKTACGPGVKPQTAEEHHIERCKELGIKP